MATIPNALNTHLTAEQVMTSFDNALTKYPATKSEVETARGTFENLDARLDDMDTTLNSAKLGIKYKGEVNYYADLPNSAEIGDAYTVKYAGSSGTTPDGTEYVWGAVSGVNQWINFSKDSYSKAEVDALLALKQNALTTAQLAAVNSGIDSTKVAQIETNKNNISSQQDTVAQGGNGYAIINGIRQYMGDTVAPPIPPNSLWLKDSVKVKTDNYFNADDFGAIQVDAQGNKRNGTNCGILPQGTYTLSATTSAPQNALFHTIKSGSTYTLVTIDSLPYTFTADGVSEQIIRVANATTTSWAENGYTNIMLNTGSTAQSYMPYWIDIIDEKIKPLENNISKDEAALVELVDGGAKNKLPNRGVMTKDSITYTWTNGDVVVSGTKTTDSNYVDVMSFVELSDLGLDAGDELVISNNGTDCYLSIIFWSQSQGYTSSIDAVTGSTEITVPTGYTHIIARLGVVSAATGTINETIQPMICSKAAWDVSQKYVPYAPTNAELYAMIQAL